MGRIYSLTGEIHSGKTHIALNFAKNCKSEGESVLLISWADPLKEVIRNCFGMNKAFPLESWHPLEKETAYQRLYKEIVGMNIAKLGRFEHLMTAKFQEAWYLHGDEIVEAVNNTELTYPNRFRTIIQKVGTEIGRAYDNNIWVDEVVRRIEKGFSEGLFQVAIIDDTRFPNEADAIAGLRNRHDVVMCGIKASIETRAKRANRTVDDLKKFADHDSERFVHELIKKHDMLIFDND